MNEWSSGDAYESYIGRWSRRVAAVFVPWLGVPPGGAWVDVGCGTGALASTVLGLAAPARVVGVDLSPAYVATARERVTGASFAIGSATALPLPGAAYDAAVSGLALNFVPSPETAVAELARMVRPGGIVAVYVWDYATGMQPIRRFFDAAAEVDPAARDADEGPRFPVCRPEPLAALFADLDDVEVEGITVPAVFRDFDDYWTPFLGGQGPAPAYLASLDADRQAAVRDAVRARLPFAPDGSIPLSARAWAVRGRRCPTGATGG
jgi:SAM-dependent methyltransferase